MCVICQVRGKSKSLTRLVGTALKQQNCSCAVVETKGANYTAIRAYAAVPQPTDTDSKQTRIDGYAFHPSTLNQNILKAQYAVRGEIYNTAVEMAAKGDKEIIYTNVGNPQQLGEKPVTFNRQVLSLVTAPFLFDHPLVSKMFPADAIRRAKEINTMMGGAVGAYSDSRGAMGVRKEVADFIQRRDGYPSNPGHIFLTDGASVSVRYVLNALIRDSNDAIMVPIPQYPLYSASIQLYGGTLLPYDLKEDAGWGMDIDAIRTSIHDARAKGTNVRALVFINPGNPTGQVLTADNLKDLARLAYEEGLVLMADEVYQPNIYTDDKPFVSAKKVIGEMGEPYASGVELASFHTVSKGVLGECGLRGGYVEFTNFHPGTIDEMYKIASVNLSPNTVGQVMMALMCNPPKPGDESYESYTKEMENGLASLRRRAHLMTDAFNSLEGVSCNFTEGAMYSFPRIRLPKKAIEAVEKAGKAPDLFYSLELLKETGIVVVQGSGFGQEAGTYHFRTTILPPEEKIEKFRNLLVDFHEKFMDKYRD